MAKLKGLFKGIKYISQIFVYKEHEMEIGHPTDVRHVAHIGWDSNSCSAPSWMTDFKTASDFSSTSLSNFGQSRETSWASQDFDQHRGLQPPSEFFAETPSTDLPKTPKKLKRKKTKESSLLSSSRSSSKFPKSRSSFAPSLEGAEVFHDKIAVK